MCDKDFTHRAVLLYGPRKSGSSLLHNLLDGGQELLMLPGELKLKSLVKKDQLKKPLAQHYVQQGRMDFRDLYAGAVTDPTTLHAKKNYSFEGLTAEQTDDLFNVTFYVKSLREILVSPPEDYPSIIRRDVSSFCEALKSSNKNFKYWAAKEVGGNTEKLIPLFKSMFPSGKVIYIARDPRFVVRSIILDRRRKNIHLGFRAVWAECLDAQNVLNYIYNTGIGQDIVVVYEMLTQNIEKEMRRLATLLEIPFEPIFCQPTTLGLPVVVRTASQRTTEVFRQAESWQKDLSAAQISAIRLFHTLKFSGYNRGQEKYVSYDDVLKRYNEHEQENVSASVQHT